MKKIIVISSMLLGGVFLSGCEQQPIVSTEPENPVSLSQNSELNITLSEIVDNPTLYLNKTIQTQATVKREDDNDSWYVEDESNVMKVDSWAPTFVASCPPSVKECSPPKTMFYYYNKKIQLSGTLQEIDRREYINNQWITTGSKYIISDIKVLTVYEI